MKDKKWVIIGIFISLFIIYFGIKITFLFICTSNIDYGEYQRLINDYKIKETKILNNENLESNKYFEFKELKIRDNFEKFNKTSEDDNSIRLTLKISENEGASLYISKNPTSIYEGICSNKIAKTICNSDIKNDNEMISYLSKQNIKKINIFTSIKDMKKYKDLNTFIKVLAEYHDIIKLDGSDYEGYLLNANGNKEVWLIKDNQNYILLFLGANYFNDDYVLDLLNTLVIQ